MLPKEAINTGSALWQTSCRPSATAASRLQADGAWVEQTIPCTDGLHAAGGLLAMIQVAGKPVPVGTAQEIPDHGS